MEYKGIKFVRKANLWIARKTFNISAKTDIIVWCHSRQEAEDKLNTL